MVLDPQQLISEHLREYFFAAQVRNPRFSIRAFAKKLGMSSSALSEVLRGKRKLSKSRGLAYAESIGLKGKKLAALKAAYDGSGSLEKLKPISNPIKEVVLPPAYFSLMADRKYFSVLGLIRAAMTAPKEIARRLNLEVKEVTQILDRLCELGVLQKNGDQYKEKDRVVFRTPEDFPESLMKQRRLQNIEQSRFALENDLPGNGSYFSTLSTDPERLAEALPILEDFMKRFCMHVLKPGSDQIFELSIEIFPWTVTTSKVNSSTRSE